MIMKKDFKFRHLAQLTIELDSPLSVGCGCPTIMTDSPVLTDINGLQAPLLQESSDIHCWQWMEKEMLILKL